MSARQQIPGIVLFVWFTVIMAIMLLNRVPDPEIFFVLALIGLMFVVEWIDPVTVQPQHMRRIKYVVAVGIIVFGYIIVRKIMEIPVS